MKVLATAYACEPGLGSEAGIGWNWTRQIARRHELVLITRENNVEAIERAAAAEGLDLTVVGHDLPYWMRFSRDDTSAPTASCNAAGSRAGTSRPSTPSRTSSRLPSMSVATTGKPEASASSTALGMPSAYVGKTNTSALR